MKNKIVFIPHDPRCGNEIELPKPAAHSIENWYKDASKFSKPDGQNGTLEEAKKNQAFPTFKNCVAFFDIMTAGYTLDTICDIEVYKDDNGVTNIKLDPEYQNFAGFRGETPGFVEPAGYEKTHFHWRPPWSIKLPNGYSALYLQPVNRNELPFLTISGIIDNDKLHITGQYPFLIQKDWVGVIPKGTPYVQIIPFKRDDWESEVEVKSSLDMQLFDTRGNYKYRKNKVNYYRDHEWSRKKFQ